MKYTENDFRQKCIDLKLTYIGFHKKHHDGSVIEFICPKHSDKGVQTSAWYHLRHMDARIVLEDIRRTRILFLL
nr:MAG TPA: hypothetical protein [Caudoviricetes sp.]